MQNMIFFELLSQYQTRVNAFEYKTNKSQRRTVRDVNRFLNQRKSTKKTQKSDPEKTQKATRPVFQKSTNASVLKELRKNTRNSIGKENGLSFSILQILFLVCVVLPNNLTNYIFCKTCVKMCVKFV